MKFRSIILAVVVSLLTSCATTYIQPQPNSIYALIQGSKVSSGVFNWVISDIDSIDNKSVSSLFSPTPKLRIQPGHHNIVANVRFLRGFMSNQYYGLVSINADIKASASYQIKATVQGTNVSAWLEDSAGHRASNVGSAPYSVLPQNQTIIMPIYSH